MAEQKKEKCGCGHEHHENCGHHEHHEHHECCGHHEHGEAHKHHEHHDCCCGHEHHHGEEKKELTSHAKKMVYTIENIDCANCAGKIEKKINELPEVEEAILTFATKQLQVASNSKKDLLPLLQQVCNAVEDGVVIKEKKQSVKAMREESKEESKKGEIFGIGAGAILFVAGILLKDKVEIVPSVLFILSYLILGGKIVLTAGKNLLKGRVFDENFLMSVATLAAFAIGEFSEAVGVMLFYRIGELFEHIAVERSRSQIMDAVDLRPEVVNKVVGENVEVIPSEEAEIGDIVLVRAGDRIPLDSVIVEGESQIDTSAVTGEPVPVKVKAGEKVTSGCVNLTGVLKIKVEKVLEDSMVSRILHSVENAASSKPKIDRFITKFARVYTPFVVTLALATAIIPSLFTGNWEHWIYTAITFLVISCPCALVLSVPLAFFSGIGAGSKRGILFKGGIALEALKDVKQVVVDKTGTITEGNFALQKCVVTEGTEEELLRLAGNCEMISTHPIGNSIVHAGKERGIKLERPQKAEEISGKGIRAMLKEGEVLCGNRSLMEENGIDLGKYEKKSYGTEVLVALNGKFIGYLVISDTIKEDAVSAVRQVKKESVGITMLTGDTKKSADAIAKEVGIESVYAQLLPQDKLERLQQIRKEKGSVMFVGDGINDAPVLAGADVGAAMGSGADVAIEVADVVFMTSSVEAIPTSIRIAKQTGKIAMQNVVFALAIKALVMVLGLFGFANMWLAVFADTGVAMLCVLNAIRILYKK
ncbi:heavy metal translocating P-type ATPase [Faecalimonas sp.]